MYPNIDSARYIHIGNLAYVCSIGLISPLIPLRSLFALWLMHSFIVYACVSFYRMCLCIVSSHFLYIVSAIFGYRSLIVFEYVFSLLYFFMYPFITFADMSFLLHLLLCVLIYRIDSCIVLSHLLYVPFLSHINMYRFITSAYPPYLSHLHMHSHLSVVRPIPFSPTPQHAHIYNSSLAVYKALD